MTERKVIKLKPGQQIPEGCTGEIVSDGGIVWEGEIFPSVALKGDTTEKDLPVPDVYEYRDITTNEEATLQKVVLKDIYDKSLEDGFTTSLGIKIACMPEDQARFAFGMVLFDKKEAKKSGTEIPIRDFDGEIYMMSYENYITLCLELGEYILAKDAQLWANIKILKNN